MTSQFKLCKTVGIHRFQTRQDGPYLQERLLEPDVQKYIMKELQEVTKPKGVKKNKERPTTIKYFMGQGISVDTPSEAADFLLKREYPDIYNDLSGFGTITIPEGYVPSISKIIDKDLIDKLDEETRKMYKDMIRKFPGDFAERIVYDGLKKYYKGKKSNVVLVQGIEIINILDPIYLREADFIIIDLDKKCIINLEVKNYLGPWDKPHKVG